ncbi:MAG: hypothetical protein P1P88_17115 [Bacteroidales bacterium]|nr:hypothetical protein [Bacteroidales bacterium]
MNEKIISIAQTFISKTPEKEAYLKNFFHLLHGFDQDSQKKLLLLIKVLNVFSNLRYFKPINRISEIKRNKLLHAIYNAPISKLRGGVNGLRSLCLLAFYSMDENRASIGYKV